MTIRFRSFAEFIQQNTEENAEIDNLVVGKNGDIPNIISDVCFSISFDTIQQNKQRSSPAREKRAKEKKERVTTMTKMTTAKSQLHIY